MPLFYSIRNSDGGLLGEEFYGEMATGEASSDAPIAARIQNDQGETSAFAAYKTKYENLPHHLKSCLDYIFLRSMCWHNDKDYVVRLLLAQGLIPEKPGEIMEDTAASNIKELIDLGMLHEVYGYYKTRLSVSKFHKKSCITEVEEHDFVFKAANLPIHASITNGGEDLPPNFKTFLIRSLFAEALGSISFHVYEYVYFSQVFLQTVCALQFILVLELDGRIEYLPDEVGELVHLRYLGLKDTGIKKLPHTIGNLQKLQTLEVTHSKLHQLPIEILNIKQLRHLIFDNHVPRGIGTLVNLYSLIGVCADAGFASELSTLTHLRNLNIRNVEDHANELYAAIFNLENLVSLSLNVEDAYLGTPLPDLEPFSPPPHIQELSLYGGLIEMPNWLASMENLIRLELNRSTLLEFPSSVLQFLPKLKHLILDDAYKTKIIGKEFCNAGGYPELETLLISSKDLVEWTEIVNGAFPSLKKLKFEDCPNLRFLPEGLQHISTIQELVLLPSHGDLARRLRGEENYKIKNISNLRIREER
ncbi:probable disease resistance RPP8-like protein 2 [Manihot esculenta]|uniref:Disease resistance R13L4/SHOC-2-like LRR domain-containing protein n=1 Tax=Manihot esculenta TaxID=3983 RepID=A0A2C9VWK5_MANES|nr:probable disease resistance RPP8-like protein 2 [Manihot esculenta]OAY50636.1 hypothetical protein MANES_05G152200v8 [Manihot esculenta]